MNEEIQKAIAKSLPAEVSTVLQERLRTCDRLETEIPRLNVRIADLETKTARAGNLDMREKAIAENEKQIADILSKLLVREALIGIRESNANERIAEMRGVVKDVFSNNRYKYRETGLVPAGVAQGSGQYSSSPMAMSSTIDRAVESEG